MNVEIEIWSCGDRREVHVFRVGDKADGDGSTRDYICGVGGALVTGIDLRTLAIRTAEFVLGRPVKVISG